MAITFVNNALGGTTTTTTFSITLPTTAAGDIIILEYVHRGTADATIGGTYTGPAFTEKHDQQFATSTFSGKTLWSRATGNHSGQTVTGSGLTNACAAIVTIYRGCLSSGDPLADATIVGEQNAAANETQAQITTATNGAWVVLVVVNSPDLAVTSQNCTSPGALTSRAEVLSTGGTDASIAHASAEKTTAGATGAFTWAQTDAASGSWAYALKPEPAGATWLAALDTSTSIDVSSANVQKRLRVSIENTGGAAGGTAFKWQYRKNSGTWTDITASSSNVKTFATAHFADGDDVPQIISGGTYQTDNNAAEESTGTFTLTAGIAAGSIFETEIALEFIKADVANTDTLDFRIVTSAGVALDAYDVTASATIVEGGAAYTLPANGATYNYTGGAVSLEQGYLVAATGTTFNYTGQAMTPLWKQIVTALGATYNYTGQAMTPLWKQVLAANGGTFNYQGQDSGLLWKQLLAANGTTYPYTGQAMTPLWKQVVSAQGAAYPYSGGDVALLYKQILSALGATFNYSGQDATLVYTPAGAFVIAADGAVYNWTGQTINLWWKQTFPTTGTVYDYTGQAVNLRWTRILTLSAQGALYPYTGQDMTALWKQILQANGASYPYIGFDVGLIIPGDIGLVAEGAVFNYNGQDASLVYSGAAVSLALKKIVTLREDRIEAVLG